MTIRDETTGCQFKVSNDPTRDGRPKTSAISWTIGESRWSEMGKSDNVSVNAAGKLSGLERDIVSK
jgi:hypothetical protein